MESDSRTVKFEHFQSVRLLFVLKMASRGGSARRVPEKEAAITYVQCDGLVSKRNQYFFVSMCFEEIRVDVSFCIKCNYVDASKKILFCCF